MGIEDIETKRQLQEVIQNTQKPGLPTDVKHLKSLASDALTQATAAQAAVPTLQPSLPPGTDGQSIYIVADATNGVVWQFRYRTASTSAYKWEFVGGGDLTAEILNAETTTSVTYADLGSPGPLVTLPLAGDYVITFAATAQNSGVGNFSVIAPKLGGAVTADNDSIVVESAIADQQVSVARTIRRNALAALAVIKLQYYVTAGTGTFRRRNLAVRPIRVG